MATGTAARVSIFRPLISGYPGLIARILLFLCLAGALVYSGFMLAETSRDKESLRQAETQTVARFGLGGTGIKKLSDKFTDKQGRLLADPPASADQIINPETIVVAHITGVDEPSATAWQQWETNLAQLTGKKVVDQIFSNRPDEVANVASGKITLLALHAVDAPFLVNNYGFQPLAVMADPAGVNGNRLDIIAPGESDIARLADIRNHRLVCTVSSSITGYRAAIAYLMRDQGLRPNVDYEVTWSLGQKRSINGIEKKEYQVAAVSDDKFQAMLAKGTIKKSDVRVIYQSPVIPRATIGCFYNLNPILAEQIRKALLTPPPASAPATARIDFLPVDYRRDFQFIRDIDDQFDPRFDSQQKRSTTAE